MIVLDIETTGTDPKKHCMLSLGAVDYDSGEEFYRECRIYPGSFVSDVALSINGFSESDIRDERLPLPHEVYEEFLTWSEESQDKMLAGHNIGHFDVLFLEELHLRINDKFPFSYRTLDLHSVAFAKLGRSLSHAGICDALGLPQEPNPHNALAGARSERDAFKILFRIGEQQPNLTFRRSGEFGKSPV